VDVAELLGVLDLSELEPNVCRPESIREGEARYRTPADEFCLSVLTPSGALTLPGAGSPEILLATEGRFELKSGGTSLTLSAGEAAFVAASCDGYELVGHGHAFRATLPPEAVQGAAVALSASGASVGTGHGSPV
jgi:mannose-6-phosphate isomerase class I